MLTSRQKSWAEKIARFFNVQVFCDSPRDKSTSLGGHWPQGYSYLVQRLAASTANSDPDLHFLFSFQILPNLHQILQFFIYDCFSLLFWKFSVSFFLCLPFSFFCRCLCVCIFRCFLKGNSLKKTCWTKFEKVKKKNVFYSK